MKSDTRSATIITQLNSQFSRHEIPETVISDNGPQFSSREFQAFAKEWEFIHRTSSPHHAQSNGMAERVVQTIKNMLKKAKADGKDPYLCLLNLRSNPMENIGASPAQLLMGQRVRTRLPTTLQLLKPTMVANAVQQLFENRQKKQKQYFDQGARALQKLHVGDNVRIWQDGTWNPAQVTGLSEQPRSYVVQMPEGQVYRRNRKFLRKSKEQSITPKNMDNQTMTQSSVCDKTEEKQEMDTQNKTLRRDVSPTETSSLHVKKTSE